MRKIIILQICTVVLLMSGCSSTAQQETSEISSITNSTVFETTSNFQTLEETTETTLIASEKYTPTEEEKTQIQNLLLESQRIFFDYVLGKEMQNHVDWNKSITTQKTYSSGETYDVVIYEIADGDVLSIADMQDKMRPFFTDKMIDYIFEECNYYYYEENGRLYVLDGVGSEGGGLGVDTLHITSVGMTDKDTLVLYMTEFGAGENWSLDYDLIITLPLL